MYKLIPRRNIPTIHFLLTFLLLIFVNFYLKFSFSTQIFSLKKIQQENDSLKITIITIIVAVFWIDVVQNCVSQILIKFTVWDQISFWR